MAQTISSRAVIPDCIDWIVMYGVFGSDRLIRAQRERYWTSPIKSTRLKDVGFGAHRLIQYAEECVRAADSNYHRDRASSALDGSPVVTGIASHSGMAMGIQGRESL